MNDDFKTAMGRALEETRAGNLSDATALIRDALSGTGGGRPAPGPAAHRAADPGAAAPTRPDLAAIEDAEIVGEDASGGAPKARTPRSRRNPETGGRPTLGETIAGLARNLPGGLTAPGGGTARPVIPEGARYEACRHDGAAGARDYRLYVPAARPAGRRGLVVMLHGCTQSADDFAAGTLMNAEAERRGFVVVYPHQTRGHNAQGCWNWFQPGDQRAGAGEPAILAALTREVALEHDVDPSLIFVAGLSAGGAMAAILGVAYPDLFAAVGVHSGLAAGSAHDVVSAFAAMRGNAPAPRHSGGRPVRTIVFHGSADRTVAPRNADAIVAAALSGTAHQERAEAGRSAGGRGYDRVVRSGRDGTARTELWRIEGAGHAWAGGSAAGSYTDPDGPSASAEMARFFFDG